MLVLTEVSSRKTRWLESSSFCSRIQRRRARATSARSCSLACRTFFVRDAVPLQKTKQRRAASWKPVLVHRCDDLVQRPISLLCDKAEDLVGVIVQRRAAPAAGLGFERPFVPPSLVPANRRTDADTKAFRRLIPRGSLFNRLNNPLAQIRRISLGHGILQCRITCQDSAFPASMGIPIQTQRKPV